MEWREAAPRARELRELLASLETRRHGRRWTTQEIALGFEGDVGDLAKLVQAAVGVRDVPDLRARLAHELGDCLWSILTLADQLDVDLERAFTKTITMTDLEQHARAQLAKA
jgi:NTP pyrophosphatase (non-canonical NTP hydrolase)